MRRCGYCVHVSPENERSWSESVTKCPCCGQYASALYEGPCMASHPAWPSTNHLTSRGGRVSEAGIQHFRRVHDDVYAMHEWPDYLFVSTELIAQAQGDGNLTVGEGVIEFKVANGGAVYKVVRMSERIWDCTLVEGTFREFAPAAYGPSTETSEADHLAPPPPTA